MDEQATISVTHVKRFLEFEAAPINMTDMAAFWKYCTPEEKDDYRRSVALWNGKTHFIQAS